jgi:hypothetical protein
MNAHPTVLHTAAEFAGAGSGHGLRWEWCARPDQRGFLWKHRRADAGGRKPVGIGGWAWTGGWEIRARLPGLARYRASPRRARGAAGWQARTDLSTDKSVKEARGVWCGWGAGPGSRPGLRCELSAPVRSAGRPRGGTAGPLPTRASALARGSQPSRRLGNPSRKQRWVRWGWCCRPRIGYGAAAPPKNAKGRAHCCARPVASSPDQFQDLISSS